MVGSHASPGDHPEKPSVWDLLNDVVESGELEGQLRKQLGRWRHSVELGDLMNSVAQVALEAQAAFLGTSREDLLAWLRPIGRSVVIDSLRQKKREAHLLDYFAWLPQRAPEESEEEAEPHKLVRELLDELTPRQRRVLHLRYFEDQSNKQIARALHSTEKAVEQVYVRAMARLRKLIEKSEADLP